MRTLQTARCTLEPQLQTHATEMFEVLTDPANGEFENEPPSSVQWLAERDRRLESRGPDDGAEQWLNWVVRLPGGASVEYVQATVLPSAIACVARLGRGDATSPEGGAVTVAGSFLRASKVSRLRIRPAVGPSSIGH